MLFLDDLHWADAASLDLLSYAGRRWATTGTPLLLVYAARTEDLITPGAGGARPAPAG